MHTDPFSTPPQIGHCLGPVEVQHVIHLFGLLDINHAVLGGSFPDPGVDAGKGTARITVGHLLPADIEHALPRGKVFCIMEPVNHPGKVVRNRGRGQVLGAPGGGPGG